MSNETTNTTYTAYTPVFVPAKIATALVKIAGEIGSVTKSKVNPAFKSAYAPLDEILASVKPVLAKNGCAVMFRHVPAETQSLGSDFVCVETLVIHESGEYVSGIFSAKPTKQDPQGVVGATTYLKRCGITALLSLELDDDDDGNSVSHAVPASRPAQASAGGSAPIPPRQAPAKPAAAPGSFEI